MPRQLEIEGGVYTVATEQELLAFANAVRVAGGANVIEALLPSKIGAPEACLIANALNFGCSVDIPRWASPEDAFESGAARWSMQLPDNLTDAQYAKLAQIEGCKLIKHDGIRGFDEVLYELLLPEHIGNAAFAFDNGAAFQEYIENRLKTLLGTSSRSSFAASR